jgi:UDPglucose--hexose-1-phosphate uridylyltransferase
MKSEIRQNKATKDWVVYSEARGKRPSDFGRMKKSAMLPKHDPDCPFCPGNEHMLSETILQIPGNDRKFGTKVIYNKFPALMPDIELDRFKTGIYLAIQGYGRHEVIIETPLHNESIGRMKLEDVLLVLETYRRRCLNISDDQRNLMTIIFRNHGPKAGTSLVHPHSQIIVTGMVPNYVRCRQEEARRHFDEFGKCVYCDIIDFELSDGKRIVFENDSFVGFVPYAAEVPFEIWILPKRHEAGFVAIKPEELPALASALQRILSTMYKALNDPDYNYVINSSTRFEIDSPYLHWFLQIRPRLTTFAGFEIGSGMHINPSYPERDAAFLNNNSA